MPASDNDTVPDLKYHLSFAGCGFLGIYHLGVARTLVRHGGRFLSKVDKFTGASAGALVAATLATTDFDQDIMEDCNQFCYDLARDIRRRALGVLTPRVTLLGPLEEFLSTMLPADAHVRATERLCVSLTSANDKDNFIISDFKDKEDLIQCLLATSCIPLLTAQRPIMYRGQKFIDGGLTDNLPLLEGGRTILVSPFSGPQDICPVDKSGRKWQVHINNQDFKVNLLNIQRGLHAFFPPTQQVLQKYFQMGQIDAAKFLKRENMYERGPKEGGSLPRSPSRPPIINDDEETQTTDVISTSDIDTGNITSKNVQYESTL